ncbi:MULTISPECIES: helix-turn-helix domain-containing protein [Nioella]|jgi:transcriptional regulator with XRE-family HTH domain|uniref:helix-turn-helix domain-containing protein n=1 Tax=Nioella TaxID=1775424 RepID=UPI0008FD85DF|nr:MULTISPECIES: helix-turn-helix domain-containing protein [Nioella]TBX25959.1 XRE family transcriptional regulator [Roseovarius sp. JS7-11]
MTDTTPGQADWFSEEIATFGDRLAGAREAAGVSQEDMARRLGVKLKTVVAWENDWSEPRANKLQMVAGLLNVSIRWLLTGEGSGPEDPDLVDVEGDLNQIILDLRQIRQEHARLGEQMGRLEKRLRKTLSKEEGRT